MVLIATKSSLTIKNVAYLTIGIKFNVSLCEMINNWHKIQCFFIRNNSFQEKFLNFNHFSSQIEKMCTFQVKPPFLLKLKI